MPDWLAITLAVLAPVLSVLATLVTVAFLIGKRVAVIETTQDAHGKALAERVTQEQGRGLQAQIKRLEAADATCDGKMTQMRAELSDRDDRLSARLSAHEQQQSATNLALTNALTKFEATFSAGLSSMKESVDRLLEAERARLIAPAATTGPSMMEMLQMGMMLARSGAQPPGRA